MRVAVAGWAFMTVAHAVFAAPAPRPKVLVEFVVEAPNFVIDLGNQKSLCESEVATAAAQQLGADFPFLEWATTGPSVHKLTLTLKQKGGGGDVDTYLEYRASDAVDGPREHLLYPWFFPRERDDLGPLITQMKEKVKADIKASSAEIKTDFTSRVPIAKSVEIERGRVIVPVTGVHADTTSVLNVTFVADNQPGEMKLRDAMAYAPRGIFCDVAFFSHGGIIQSSLTSAITRLITEQAKDIRVLMLDYRGGIYANARDGAVTTFR